MVRYKIIQRDGSEVESGFRNINDALARLRQIKRSGKKQLIVVDADTKVGKKPEAKT